MNNIRHQRSAEVLDGTSVDPLGQADLASPSRRYVWYVILLLTLVNVFNFIDRMALSVLMPFIKAEMHLTDGQLGLLVGFSFAIFYVMCGIPIARLADRGVRRDIIAIAVAAWSVMTALNGAAQNFLQLFLARIGVGAGESGSGPAAASLLCDYIPYEQRPAAFAVQGFGLTIGTALGMGLAGVLAESIGWRWAFVALGLPGIAFALVIKFTLREPPRGGLDKGIVQTQPPSFGEILGILSRCRTYMLITLYTGAAGFLQYGLNQWLPSFYERLYGMSLSSIGVSLGIALSAGTGMGLLIGGVLAQKAGRHDVRRPFLIGIAVATLALPTVVAALLVSSALISILLIALTSMFWSVPTGLIVAAASSVVSAQFRATAYSITMFVITLIGLGMGPLSVGLLSDALVPLYGPESLRYALLAPTCLLPVMAILLWAASRTLSHDLKAAGAL